MSLLKRKPGQDPKASRPLTLSEVAPSRDVYLDLKSRVQSKISAELDPMIDISNTEEIRRVLEELFDNALSEENIILSRVERQRLFEQVVAEVLGLGPLEPLLSDRSVDEIMVNGPRQIYVERKGRLERTNLVFESNDHLRRIIDRIVLPLGRRIDESSPYVDARLPEGSYVNAVIPPLSFGPTLTIRKFSTIPLTIDDLIRFGTLTPEAIELLKACVRSQLNILLSGGIGSGRTTTINILSSFIPDDERIITIEKIAELQLRQEHVVTLECRPPNIDGEGEVDLQDLAINCLSMRPDRVVLGELGPGMYGTLMTMTNACGGFLSTMEASSPRDAVAKLERWGLEEYAHLPVSLICQQLASCIDLIVHQDRLPDGSRRVVNITEVCGAEGQGVSLRDIFAFERAGIEGDKIIGRLKPTGYQPIFLEQIEAHGIHLLPLTFGIRSLRR